jgi:uncharacterized protein (UPF0333 family)
MVLASFIIGAAAGAAADWPLADCANNVSDGNITATAITKNRPSGIRVKVARNVMASSTKKCSAL